jgi:hypothetical protein
MFTSNTKLKGIFERTIQRVEIEMDGNVIQASDFVYSWNIISERKRDTYIKL